MNTPGATITATPGTFAGVSGGNVLTVTVNVDNDALLNKWVYGGVTLTNQSGDGRPNLRLPVAVFATFADARSWIDRVVAGQALETAGWAVAHVLEHCAQSIEYSIHGYPEAKPVWFQLSSG